MLDLGFAGEMNGFAPSAVTPAAAMLVFIGSVLRVVDENVGAIGVDSERGICGGIAVFVIAGVDDGFFGRLDAISGGAVRVMEGEGAD